MEGVILFADDHVFDSERIENKLFQKFNSDENYTVLPVNNLDTLEKAVASISTFKALILDWNFKRGMDGDEEDGIEIPDENPYDFLKSKKIYSLVYVYSQNEVAQGIKEELEQLYAGKIYFNIKENTNESEKEYEKISQGIQNFEDKNKHLTVPFVWSQSINQSVQAIFSELEQSDPNWAKEIYNTAKNDGAEPNTEIIGVFLNLLNETIIQNEPLLKALNESVQSDNIAVQDKETSLAKLYNRIYYTKLIKNAPLMTGDIFKFNDNDYGILFTPECDVNIKKETTLEFVIFNKNNYEDFLKNKRVYEKSEFENIKSKGYKNDNQGNPTEELKGKLKELVSDFNNGNIKNHILPSFPFESEKYNLSALIDFETAFVVKSKTEFEGKRAEYKLNSPYIYQLRQRYLAYIGRVGVPAIPQCLRLFNLK
jgi:hypothetical protein